MRNLNHLRRKWSKRVKWCLTNVRAWNQVWVVVEIKLRFVDSAKEGWVRIRSQSLKSWEGFTLGSVLTWGEKEFLKIDWRQISIWAWSMLKFTSEIA